MPIFNDQPFLPEPIVRSVLEMIATIFAVYGDARQVFAARDGFDRYAGGRLAEHFVVVAMLCEWTSGRPLAGHDVLGLRVAKRADSISPGIATP